MTVLSPTAQAPTSWTSWTRHRGDESWERGLTVEHLLCNLSGIDASWTQLRPKDWKALEVDGAEAGRKVNTNQPQVLHTSKGKFTDNTCCMAGRGRGGRAAGGRAGGAGGQGAGPGGQGPGARAVAQDGPGAAAEAPAKEARRREVRRGQQQRQGAGRGAGVDPVSRLVNIGSTIYSAPSSLQLCIDCDSSITLQAGGRRPAAPGNSNDANQPQVLHASTGTCTDNTCLMAGRALRGLLPEVRDPARRDLLRPDHGASAHSCSPYG